MGDALRIEDVAAASGVSKSTVSQVLRNTGRISSSTRDKVLKTAEELGYVYNRAAAGLRAGHSTLIGIGITSLTNPFFADLVEGASAVLDDAGFFSVVVALNDKTKRQERFAVSLRENAAAGAILCPSPQSSPTALGEWKSMFGRCVAILRPTPTGLFDFVGVDNAAGMRLAADHLVGAGHRSIGYLGGLEGSHSRHQRLEGWVDALRRSGIEPQDDWIEPCDASITAASQAVERLLERCPNLTAIICHQDIVAFGATIGLRKRKLTPGVDLSVVGFDNITMSQDWDPPLTTVSVSPRQLGEEAARLLVRRIAEPTSPLKSVFVQPELVVRQSTRPLSPPGGNGSVN